MLTSMASMHFALYCAIAHRVWLAWNDGCRSELLTPKSAVPRYLNFEQQPNQADMPGVQESNSTSCVQVLNGATLGLQGSKWTAIVLKVAPPLITSPSRPQQALVGWGCIAGNLAWRAIIVCVHPFLNSDIRKQPIHQSFQPWDVVSEDITMNEIHFGSAWWTSPAGGQCPCNCGILWYRPYTPYRYSIERFTEGEAWIDLWWIDNRSHQIRSNRISWV